LFWVKIGLKRVETLQEVSQLSPLTLKIIFMIGIAISLIIRIPFQREQRRNTIIDERKTAGEKVVLFLIFVGMLLLPFVYILSPWLNFANYRLPSWANGLGVVTFAIALWLFWRAHADLGRNWSPTLQIREGHTLTTNGVYHTIRHPMYTSALLWCIAQALLLPNWIAGWLDSQVSALRMQHELTKKNRCCSISLETNTKLTSNRQRD
jgi:protein-S-isoprenylcysteine O-methyltransferase Ste14